MARPWQPETVMYAASHNNMYNIVTLGGKHHSSAGPARQRCVIRTTVAAVENLRDMGAPIPPERNSVSDTHKGLLRVPVSVNESDYYCH